MLNFTFKIFPALFFWGVFGYIVLQVPYPQSITQAGFLQLSLFFIPLSLAILFTLNIFLKMGLISGSLSLGIIFLLILKALDSLNLITGSLIIVSVGLLISYFRKRKVRGIRGIRRIRWIRKNRRNHI